MRIGVLTLPLHFNFGGILQAYALQTILEREGHEVVVFGKNRQQKFFSLKKLPIYIYRFAKKYILRKKNVDVFFEAKKSREFEKICVNTSAFVKSKIHERRIKSFNELKESDFDVLVVGSDQIWRPRYVKSSWNTNVSNAMLKFAEHWNVKKIAYAASFGTEQWELSPKETEEWKRLAALFNAVSVREKDGVGLCNSYLGVVAQVVLDPTLLLSKEDYCSLIKNSAVESHNGDFLNYILDSSEKNEKLISQIAEKFCLKVFRVNAPVDKDGVSIEKRIQPSVEQWLKGFEQAKFIATDSFHACVFAIIFRKPFVVFLNKNRGCSRIKNLLSTFDLESHLIDESSVISDMHFYAIPESVYEKLRNLKADSMKFLNKYLV